MPTPQPSASGTPISPGFVKAALAIERYVLPWAYAFFASQRLDVLLRHYSDYRFLHRVADIQGIPAASLNIAFALLAKDLLLFLLMVFTGVTLLFSRAPVTLPDKLKHIVVPLAMSYYFFLYGIVDGVPRAFRQSLLPPELQGPAAVAGLLLSLLGYGVAIWAFVHLGRSFAILVSVRKVVSSGPYAYVRHPIYLGYAIELAGLLLASCSPAMLLLGAGFLILLVHRAQIEEEMLCGADEGYRQHVRRTGFLFPRFSKTR